VKLALAQLNTRVGAIEENTSKVLEAISRARDELCSDLVIFPELTLSGYPPEDLLLHSGLRKRVEAAFERVQSEARGIAVLLGLPEYMDGAIYNAAVLLDNGEVLAKHRKLILPNYAVFDEKRYFTPGDGPTVAELGGMRLGIVVCEDVWEPGPARATAAAGADVLLVINGSPFHIDQQRKRETMVGDRARENGVPVVYLNMVGGQDELVFDGGSFAVDANGALAFRGPWFDERMLTVDLELADSKVKVVPGQVEPMSSTETMVYRALVTGTRDYVDKNGFPGIVLGLSGGIDSALTLAVAVDALGCERVHAVMMPSRYTSEISLADAAEQAHKLGVRYEILSIEPIYEAAVEVLKDIFAGRAQDTTEENIQSRCRGILLMAISNKLGSMLLTTGNKSEMAVGYATLYGDMAGGFAPLKDCSKTLVYRLARYRNGVSEVIPERVIVREPTAELRADQKDSDSLPPYDLLDPILEAFIEKDWSVEQISELGYERELVVRILKMVKRAEYKRRQAPPGVRVSNRAFGRDWRYPITSGY